MNAIRRLEIAVVDDDDAVRNTVRDLLEFHGYNVAAYSSGADFLAAANREVGCLIVDYTMPAMTGVELVERVRSDGATYPVVLMSGHHSSTILARADELGINKIVAKPFSFRDLLEFLNSACSADSRVVE